LLAALLAKIARGDIETPPADGSTALLWAAHLDDREAVETLLREGANPSTANRYGISPLYEACVNGDAAIVEDLIKAGADANGAGPEGETPLMTASRTGNAEAVKMLLDHGARVNAKENWRGQTALMWAAAEMHPAVVRMLTEHGADVNARSRVFDYTKLTPKQGSVPMNYPRGGFTALLFAAREGDVASGRTLVSAKADVNLADPDGTTPLIEAIINFHFDFAMFLLEHGADPNARDSRGRGPLYAATDMHSLDTSTRPNPGFSDVNINDSLDVIKALLARGANPNAELIDAIPPRGPLDVADYTLGAGATPFLRAAKADDLEVMRLLLEKKANPLLATKAGVTPLMAAAGIGWRDGKSHGTEADAIEAIKLCLDRGANINAVADKGQTALQGASLRGADTVIAYLISRGADVNAKDEKGRNTLGNLVQTFSAKVSAAGTSTGGVAPSVPATLECKACTGKLTATSSAGWLAITSTAGGAISFNVFGNTSKSARTGVIQVTGASNKVTVTIEEAGSEAPVLKREVTYLYQHVLGREPDAAGLARWTGRGATALGRMTRDLLESAEARDTDWAAMAKGAAGEYSTWLEAVQAIRSGQPGAAQTGAVRAGDSEEHPDAVYVTMLYYVILERTPNPAELDKWLRPGATALQIIDGLTASGEFLARFQ
jgi:ankyrin repeat protein